MLQLTSGTTSAPKAVRVTHGNIQANTESIVEYLGLQADDRMLVVLPFSYCFGASLLHTHLRVGGSVALCHTLTFPETVVDAIVQHHCTGFAGVPSTYQLLLRASSLSSRPLPSLRHLQQAGGKLPPTLIDELVAAQPGARVFVMYGQAEATARLSFLPPEDIGRRRGSIGRGIPRVQLRVVDEDDQDVAPGAVGEIVASGPSITKGYWNDPEATAQRYRGGSLRTGDLATVDEDGYVYIVDRAADFIKSWGIRISSQEIEEAALRVPSVMSAAAVGVPDEIAGEAIVLFVVTRDDELTPDDVLTALRGVLAKHMVPHQVRIVSELPLNANGKLVKSQLRELAATSVWRRCGHDQDAQGGTRRGRRCGGRRARQRLRPGAPGVEGAADRGIRRRVSDVRPTRAARQAENLLRPPVSRGQHSRCHARRVCCRRCGSARDRRVRECGGVRPG